jgi:short-subunit dehydrogenase
VNTAFFRNNGVFVPSVVSRLLISPERCAETGLRALFKGRRTRVTGFTARVHLTLFWLMPRPWFYTIARRAYFIKKRG